MAPFIKDESGATSIEYALIASIISIAIVAVIPQIEGKLVIIFNAIVTGLS